MKFSTAQLFQPTILMALTLMGVIVMMILPVPAWVLDIGLAASFALAILIFTVTLFIERPLEFSAFPTILLAALMLRLSLNVSSTKLIIGEGHSGTAAAGDVIQGFALFIMSGSVFLGLVIFGVLMIVNFIVITKGAGRMAEVGARFALDGMPGKQLAIDSDVAAGAINHEEAKARREREQAETTFFGSLDGASKFVKGDAVAGLLITMLNLLVGLSIGVVQHDMPFGTAFETYAILTVGDGLVTQIPAVIISIASALLVSRTGATDKADVAFFDQLGRHPSALGTVASLMILFALVPGLPFIPFLLGGIALGYWAYRIAGKPKEITKVDSDTSAPIQKGDALGDLLDLDDIHIAFAPDLVAMVLDPATGIETRIGNMRSHIATEYGVILPDIRLTDEAALPNGAYRIYVQGVSAGDGDLRPDRVLALLPEHTDGLPAGEDVQEPVYKVPARWLAEEDRDAAALAGLTTVSATEVLATHLLEVIKQNLARLLTLKSLRRLLDALGALSDSERAGANKRLFDEMIPDKVPMDLLLAVLRALLDESVSIRNLPAILEAISDGKAQGAAADAIVEYVRQRLSPQLISGLKRADGTIPLVQIAHEWEAVFTRYQVGDGPTGGDVALPPEEFQKLTRVTAEKLAKAAEVGASPAIATSARRRRYVRTLLKAAGILAPVLSFEELGTEARPSLMGVVPP